MPRFDIKYLEKNMIKRIKEKMVVDDQDDNDERLYKNVRPGGPGPGGAKDYRKPRNMKATLTRVLSYTTEKKALLVGVLIMLVVSTGCSLLASYFLKPIVDDYIIPNITAVNKDFTGLARQLALLGGIYLATAVTSYLQSRIMVSLAQSAVNRIRRDLFSSLQDLPITYYDEHTHGELMSRFTNDADNVQMMLEQSLMQFISGIITFVGTIALMLVLSWRLFLVTAVTALLSLLVVNVTGRYSKVLFKKQQAALGGLNGFIEEMIDGLRVVKAFNYEKRAKEEFGELDDDYLDNGILANLVGQSVMPILGAVMNICYAVTAVIGAIMVAGSAGFTVGSLALFLTYTRQVAMPINMMSNQVVNLMSAVAGAERVFDVMDTRPEVDDGNTTLVTAVRNEDGSFTETEGGERTGFWAWKVPVDGGYEYRQVKGDVRLNDVFFQYVPDNPVLKGISVYAKPGQKIAFVGSTGAGKTTITNLINRFYEIDGGSITYDGIDIRDIKKAGLRRSLGVVLQDTNLFTGTVMDNIRYGKLDATDEECIEAAKSANAHRFITRLPDGYMTELSGNGNNLSQGQRQLLAISRTAAAKHPVMILDEATSSIDTRTEKLIENGLDSLMKEKTVFVIAHRLSTVRNSKAIAVIEHGEIIEKGNHEELLENKGRYYMLYTGQHELD